MTAQTDTLDSERTPLLQRASAPPQTQPTAVESQDGHDTAPRRSTLFIIAILVISILLVGTGDEIQKPAQTRIFESIFCRQYYTEHDPSLIGSDGGNGVAEKFCKNHVIQGDVAMLRGWKVTIEAFVMLLVSVPWGYAADVWGRRPVLVIQFIGLFLRTAWIQFVCRFWWAIPIKAVWASAFSGLFGGGEALTVAIFFTVVADCFPQKARASKFIQIAGLAMLTQVIGPFAAGALMQIDPWVPMIIGLTLEFFAVLAICLVPETKGYMEVETGESQETTSESFAENCKPSLLQNLREAAQDSITFLAADKRLLLLMPAFVLHMLIASNEILLQYVSIRYNLPLSNATLVLTLRSAWILALMLLLYPALNHILRTRLSWSAQHADLLLAQFCTVATAFGFLLMAVAPSIALLIAAMAINTLGAGMNLYLRSLATSFVETHHVARLMTFISWIDLGGLMVASPLLAWLFERGMDRGGLWMGLPWLFTAAVFAVIGVMLGMVYLRPDEAKPAEEEPLVGLDDDEDVDQTR